MKICGLEFKMTCAAYPEQYDVYKDDEYVAYIRLRWGELVVRPVINNEVDWRKEIYSVDFGNIDGQFIYEKERIKWLKKCATEINEWIGRGRFEREPKISKPSKRDKFVMQVYENLLSDIETKETVDWKPLKFQINRCIEGGKNDRRK